MAPASKGTPAMRAACAAALAFFFSCLARLASASSLASIASSSERVRCTSGVRLVPLSALMHRMRLCGTAARSAARVSCEG